MRLAMNATRIPRMTWLSILLFGLGSLRGGAAETAPKFEPMKSAFSWTQLPSIPDQEGFAGAFAGVSNGALLVAGGANIIGQRWDNPIQKKWYASVFVLQDPDGKWTTGFELPHPLGYGVSITSKDGLICVGGSDTTRHFSDVFELQWRNGAGQTIPLPALPTSCAQACGALLGNTIYVAGGLETPTSEQAMRTFWALDLTSLKREWKVLEPWPGPERMLAVAGVQEGSFFLMSGTRLVKNSEGKVVREYLRDAYRFSPGQGWMRTADLPRAAVAAPTPAPTFGQSFLLVLTGDDGANVDFSPIEKHPGFPQDMLCYETASDTWKNLGSIPFSRATAPTVLWRNRVVIPNGEVRPRVRTPEVWSLEQGSARGK
jgi:N-acetylneuraminic acid mutarotase